MLDADVIIHFTKGGRLSELPSYLPGCDFVVLDVVRGELRGVTGKQLDNQISLIGNISLSVFGETLEMQREYARLRKRGLGRGESASMVFCRFNRDVVGSSNLRDITEYCDAYGITYLTTIDFLYYGISNGVITPVQAVEFIRAVREKGSRLPDVDFCTYVCDKII